MSNECYNHRMEDTNKMIAKRDCLIAARVTQKEYNSIASEAKRRNQRKSDFVREMLMSHIALYETIKKAKESA